jgi:hypothetical protein
VPFTEPSLPLELRVVVTDGSGKKTVFRRRVRLFRKKKARK